MTACNEMVMEPDNMGTIALSLSSSVEVDVATKADDDYSDYIITVTGTKEDGSTFEPMELRYEDIEEKISVPFGEYVLSAQSCTELEAEEADGGYGCVRYVGKSGVIKVESDEPVAARIACTMANAKASITFDGSFLEDFSDVRAELKIGDRKLPISKEQADAEKPVYFNVDDEGSSLVYVVYGTIAKGTANEKQLTYTNASSPILLYPAKWAKITIRSNHNGIIGPGIGADDSMKDDPQTEVIDPEEGTEVLDGDLTLPSILVDTAMDDATIVIEL